MLLPTKIFFVLGTLLVGQSAWAFVDGLRFRALVRNRFRNAHGSYAPYAAVLVPCKGVDVGLAANLDRYLDQDYPDYQIIFIVAGQEDPAYPVIQGRLRASSADGEKTRPQASLVVAGFAEGRGEKVNNLLRGVEAVSPAAQVLVFADIDGAPAADWLRSLVAPLASSNVTVCTGFRWYLPGQGLVSRLRAAWDTSIATMMGEHSRNFAWGGSMAIRTADFRRLEVAERYWANTVSDDYAMTTAVRDAGGRIAFAPRCLVASREESSLREFLRWSTRQIIITRVYAAHLWRLGVATYLFYCGTLVLGLAVLAMPKPSLYQRCAVTIVLVTILLLGAAKGYIRTLVARDLFPAESSGQDACYWQISPLVPWVMLWNFVMAGVTRRIEWRGTVYDLVSRDQIRVVKRSLP